MKKEIVVSKLLPLLFGFFVMGFVDVVGISTSYVKQDFALNDKLANLLPIMVFLWFALFSLPTGLIMGKIGRKKTVLWSAVVTTVAMLIPLVEYSFPFVLVAFALLGIGNTLLQVSMNPLVTNIVSEDKLTSTITFGYFIKAISSFLGPVIIGVTAGIWGNWKLIFPIYAAITLLSFVWLLMTPIEEEKTGRNSSMKDVFILLKDKHILTLFSIIVLIVGFEIGLMTAVPKYLLERCRTPLEQGGLGCSLYYAARTIGTFIGSILLTRISSGKFFIVSVAVAIITFVLFMVVSSSWMLLTCLFVIGLTCANVFSIAFSDALQVNRSKANEISALIIMGIAGGALLPPVMGVVSDISSQHASLFILLAALVYVYCAAICVLKK